MMNLANCASYSLTLMNPDSSKSVVTGTLNLRYAAKQKFVRLYNDFTDKQLKLDLPRQERI